MKLASVALAALLALLGVPAASLAGAPVQIDPATVNFTPSQTAYAIGQCLGPAAGSAIIDLGALASSSNGTVTMRTLGLIDGTGALANSGGVSGFLFTQSPAGTYTDQQGCGENASDRVLERCPFAMAQGTAWGANSSDVAVIGADLQASNLNCDVKTSNNQAHVFMVLIVQGTPTLKNGATTPVIRVVGSGYQWP